ncbi:hypothetical protein ACFOYW_18395 [Gryllotalpicola reticulitermitis]|uniref:Uncharacterized protein n=1 Tax=Gryllotalpicola reticulitermitis TaxID=1184153 RepID=A0ABV8QCE8_9MICO
MWVIFVLLAIFVGTIVLVVTRANIAKQQRETVVTLSPARAKQVIDDAYSKLMWADVQGPGQINKRRKIPLNNGPVISIDVEPTGDNRTHVTLWLSRWSTKNRVALVDGVTGSEKRAIRKLEEAQNR